VGHPLNPGLRATVQATGIPVWRLAAAAGFLHAHKFSGLINAASVPATAINVSRLEKIASAVGFDKARLFLNGDQK